MYSCLFAFYILLLNLKYGNFRSVGIECDWSIERLQCPPYGTTDWECLKAHLKCSSGKEYHCVRDERGKWIQTCAEEKTCLKGQEPVYAENYNIICQSCRNPERYEPVESTLSYKFSECRRKKKPCPMAVSYECPNETVKYIQNRMCGCDYENDFIPQNYNFDTDTWKCKDPDDLNCVQDPCPEDALGRNQARGPDYRCSATNVRPKPSPTNIPVNRSSSVAIIKTTPRAVKIDAKEEGGLQAELKVIAAFAIVVVIVLVAFILYVVYRWITDKRLGPPGSPCEPFEATSIEYTSLVLSWDPPVFYGGCLLTGYVLEMKEIQDIFWKRFATILQEEKEFKVTGLTDGTKYLFQVAAKNKKGMGEFLEMKDSVLTKTITVSPMPQNLTGYYDKESMCIKLSWNAPAGDGGTPIIEYLVEYCNTSNNDWIKDDPVDKDTTMWTKCDLVGGAIYMFRISARNKKGFSEVRELKESLKFLSKPSSPTNVNVKSVESDKVVLVWKAPENDGGSKIEWYYIQKKQDGNAWEDVLRVRSPTMSQRIIGLTPEKAYYFGVCAVNEFGKSEFINTTDQTVIPKKINPPDIPNEPVKVLEIGCTYVILSWQPPKSDGGSPVTGYFIDEKGSLWSKWRVGKSEPEDTKCRISRLSAGTQYTFCIYAQNAKGNSNSVEISVKTKHAIEPGKPVGPVTFSNVTAKEVTLSWNPPDNDGGLPIIGYYIEYFDSYTKSYNVAAKSNKTTTLTQKNLHENREYIFHVRAINAKGRSEVLTSDPITPYQFANAEGNNRICKRDETKEGTSVDKDVPSKPSDISINVKDSKLIVNWKPPLDEGGSKVERYYVFLKQDDGNWQEVGVVKSSKQHYKIEKLTPDTNYFFRVYTQNANGFGEPIETSTPTVLQEKKWRFSKSLILKPEGRSEYGIQAEKISSSSAEDSVESQEVQGAGVYNRLSLTEREEGTPSERENLLSTEGTSIDIQLKDSYFSKPELPCAPGKLQVKHIDTDGALLEWTKPEFDGGSKCISFHVEKREANSNEWVFIIDVKPSQYSVRVRVEPYKEMYYSVAAENAAGIGPAVKTDQAIEPPAPPSSPTGPLIASDVNTDQLALSWHPPEHNGGSSLIGYILQKREPNAFISSGWSSVIEITGDTTECLVENLKEMTEYCFRVSAKNSIGTSKPLQMDGSILTKRLAKVYKDVIDLVKMELKEQMDPIIILDGLKRHHIGTEHDYRNIQDDSKGLEKNEKILEMISSKGLDVYKTFKVILFETNHTALVDHLKATEERILAQDQTEKDATMANSGKAAEQPESLSMKIPVASVQKQGFGKTYPDRKSDTGSFVSDRAKAFEPKGTEQSAKPLKSQSMKIPSKNQEIVKEVGSNDSATDKLDQVDGGKRDGEDKAGTLEDWEKQEKEACGYLNFIGVEKRSRTWEDLKNFISPIKESLKGGCKTPATPLQQINGTKYKIGKDILPKGLEAYEVSGQDNSLFKSVSCALFGNENFTHRLRLKTVFDGIDNCNVYVNEYFKDKDKESIKKFMSYCLSDESLQKLGNAREEDHKYLAEFTVQMAVRETAIPESMSNPLQVQFLSNTINMPIQQYFQGNKNFFGDPIDKGELAKPVGMIDNVKEYVHILWVHGPKLGNTGVKGLNYIVPVAKKDDSKHKR